MKNALKILAAVLVLGGAQSALAAPIDFQVILNGPNESPPNASLGTGTADIFLDQALQTLQVNITFSGLTGTTTASHIHCCTTVPFSTGTGGSIVATTTPTFAGFPLGVTSGTYTNTLDLTLASSYNPAFVTAKGGVPGAEAALIAGMFANEAYLNIHSTFVPGGEIRGYLVYVPEPMTLSVFGVGLAGAAALRRRKKKPA